MGKYKVDPATLNILAGQADQARQNLEAARARFAGAAAGAGSGFGDAGLASQYERAYQHALAMADSYTTMLTAQAKALRAAATAYQQADAAAAQMSRS
jgi:uncharacterized protein YukE